MKTIVTRNCEAGHGTFWNSYFQKCLKKKKLKEKDRPLSVFCGLGRE